jgi:hypothetical protein
MGRRIRRHRKGHVVVDLDADERRILGDLADQLRQLLLGGEHDATRRLFPTAHPDDPRADAEYRSLVHDSLLERRLSTIEQFEATLTASSLDAEQLATWVAVLNDLRLVLGTLLDVSEDDVVIDPDDENVASYAVYHYLGLLVEESVDVLVTTLPADPGC